MRYPEGHKEAVRAKIVKVAAAAFRKAGTEGVGIPAVMKKAGLTHGGFYAHFKDRDALLAAAVEAAAQETASRVFGPDVPAARAVRGYLSPEHVARPADGCVIAALGAEGPRQAAPVRRAFAKVARGFLDLVGAKVDAWHVPGDPSDKALASAATLVGAVVLARLVDDAGLSRRILDAAAASTGTSPRKSTA